MTNRVAGGIYPPAPTPPVMNFYRHVMTLIFLPLKSDPLSPMLIASVFELRQGRLPVTPQQMAKDIFTPRLIKFL